MLLLFRKESKKNFKNFFRKINIYKNNLYFKFFFLFYFFFLNRGSLLVRDLGDVLNDRICT
jgi:hypothetical protein